MSVQTFVLGCGQTLKLDAPRWAAIRVRSGDVWLTQYNDGKDHILGTNHPLALNGEGYTIITAYQPTVLDLYRRERAAVREAVERGINQVREAIRASFTQLFY